MDNLEQLSSLLAPILNDPEAMAGIAQAASNMGFGDLLGGTQPEEKPHDTNTEAPSPVLSESIGFSGDIMSAFGKIAPLISGMGKDDDATRLLNALRPFLHGDRANRLDEAQRMIKMLHMVTSLRDQGIL